MTATIDLDMLAYDIAKMINRCGYDLDASAADIRPALPAFIEAVHANAVQVGDEPGRDAMTWTPESEQVPEPVRHVPSQYGRVRVYPVYVFATSDPSDPDVDEAWITDLDKRGEAWARSEAERIGPTGGTVGRLLRKDVFRWRPLKGAAKDAKPW